ncbi:Rha family transcriptional regulator [Escherichia coli]|uniref:Rha family phage regulatory protein n=3 Tax=Escherichia coli TaxID=562 RepID=UPI003D804EE1
MALEAVRQQKRITQVEEKVSHVAETVEQIKKGTIREGYAGYRQLKAKTGLSDDKCRNLVNAYQIPTDTHEFMTPASFLSSAFAHIQIMVGWAGAPKGSPVSVDAGTANPVQSATSEFRSSGGGSFPQSTEAAIMATIPTLTQPEIAIVDGQAVTSSLAVANFFSKRHDDVLKKIRTLECSASFTARNFSVSDYTDCTGRKLPCYQITRDGFAFLAMGFTGKRAARFKEAYINAFNLMEKSLSGADASDMSAVARNARGVYLHLREIHQIWTSQLYPMLKAVESPLASKLYDRVGDAVFGAALVDSRLNGSDKEVRP